MLFLAFTASANQETNNDQNSIHNHALLHAVCTKPRPWLDAYLHQFLNGQFDLNWFAGATEEIWSVIIDYDTEATYSELETLKHYSLNCRNPALAIALPT